MTPDYSTKRNRDFWRFVYRTAIEVASWPAWKRCGTDGDATEAKRRLADLDSVEASR